MIIPWYIELLGHLRLQQGPQEITRFRTRKNAALLAYLAYFSDRAHPREVLIEFLWPDAPLEAGRNNLSVSLNSLRRQLEPPGVPSGAVLIADRSQARLNSAAIRTDVAAFEATLQAGQQAESDKERIALLTQAADTYRGPLLPGFYEDWVLVERDRLADAYRMALRQLIKCLVQERSLESAIEYAHRVVQMDPLREQAHRELIRLYIGVGRPEAALEQFHQLESLLAQTLGASPSTATRELAASLQSSRSHTATLPPATAVPSSLTVAPAQMMPTTPANVPGPPRGNLPLVFSRFFGRERELQSIEACLDTTATCLVTLTGPGGAGKTRLAQEAARQLQGRFPGGVWFVPLADLTDAARIPDSIRDALGLSRSGAASVVEQIAQALSQQSALLVLDNLEHLGAAGAQTVQILLERAANLAVLVTSRQPLALAAEQEIAVPPLPTPSLPGMPERLLEFPSVQLFVDRAQARRVDFQITSRNAASIRALCDRLEGLPLAIELAAAWAKLLTPQQMLSQLEHRFDFLVSRRTDLPERHRTLRAVIEGSYRLLSPELQRFFAALSVFRGGWTLETAEAICAEPQALALMAQLRDRSVLVAEETDAADTDTMRYRMLESLREYAAELLTAEAHAILARRHTNYFLQMAEEAGPHLVGEAQGVWLERLAAEHENLRAALAWSLDVSSSAASSVVPEAQRASAHADEKREMALRFCAALQQFWERRGYLTEGRDYVTRALAQDILKRPTSLRATVLNGAGLFARLQGAHDTARLLFEESLAIYRSLEDSRGLAIVLSNLGMMARQQGDQDGAYQLYNEALARHRAIGNRIGETIVLNNLGNMAYEQGDYAQSLAYHEQSLALKRELKDQRSIAYSLGNLSYLMLLLEGYDRAHAYVQESLTLFRQLEDKMGLAIALEGFALLAKALAQPRRAVCLFSAMDTLRENMGAPLPPREHAKYEKDQAELRAALGEAAFVEAVTEGQVLSLEQAITYALAVKDSI